MSKSHSSAHSVSEIITESLLEAGAKRCYGIVGDTINHFTDAIRRSEIEWVHVRHEEVAGFAAGGESFISGELTCCAGTCRTAAADCSSRWPMTRTRWTGHRSACRTARCARC